MPFSAQLSVMGHSVRLETNSPAALDSICAAFSATASESESGFFLWRLIVEPDVSGETPLPPILAFSHENLSLANISQYSFIAVDRAAREAVTFVEERFTKDAVQFERLLDALLRLTAKATAA